MPFSQLARRRSLLSDIKPDNILIDATGHVKLSDFGLSTGFHKQHDSQYYQRLLGGGDVSSGNTSKASQTQSKAAQSRNSVMVNAINLQMTTKNDIATWKANRRKLAYSTVGTPDYVRDSVVCDEQELMTDFTRDLLAAGLWKGM
jgi:protein-serine/threonine kinase